MTLPNVFSIFWGDCDLFQPRCRPRCWAPPSRPDTSGPVAGGVGATQARCSSTFSGGVVTNTCSFLATGGCVGVTKTRPPDALQRQLATPKDEHDPEMNALRRFAALRYRSTYGARGRFAVRHQVAHDVRTGSSIHGPVPYELRGINEVLLEHMLDLIEDEVAAFHGEEHPTEESRIFDTLIKLKAETQGNQ